MSKMKPDKLGAKGEKRFAEWCEDESLICNKVERDLAGWDFIIDFDHDKNSLESLDNRKASCSCLVQVKTVYDTTGTVKVRLNMAERLAKDLKPSFIVILKVREDKSFSEAYVLHVMGGHLETILKRLRSEQEKSQQDKINKKFIQFRPDDVEKIGLSGAALKDAILAHVGKDMHAYAVKKAEQIKTLGYGPRAFEGKFTICEADAQKLVQVFLGEVEDIGVDEIEISEMRFDIRLQQVPPTSGRISIQPNPIDRCVLKFRFEGSEFPIVLGVDAFVSPWRVDDRVSTMFRCDLLKVSVDICGGKIDYALTFSVDGKSFPVDRWIEYCTLRKAICSGGVLLEIETTDSSRDMVLPFGKREETSDEELEYADLILKSFGQLQRLQKLSGLPVGTEFLADDVHGAIELLHLFDHMLEKKEISFHSATPLPDGRAMSGVPIIVANRLQIGSSAFGYYGVAEVDVSGEGEGIKIEVRAFAFKRAETLGDGDSDFEAFRKRAIDREGIDAHMSTQLD